MEDKARAIKWYLKPVSVVVAILLLGPFAIPMVWLSPAFKLWHKIAITLLLVALTVVFVKASANIYTALMKEFKEIEAMR